MTTWLPKPAVAAVGAALLLVSAGAYAQLPSAEQRAFDAVDSAISAFESASGRDEITRAAGQIIDDAERALNAFNAADSARAAAAARYEAALEELIFAARETFVVLESHIQLVEQAARDYERDPDQALPGQDDVVRQDDVESEPAGDFAGWGRAVNGAVAEAERAAAEAEQAGARSGSWWSRVTACLGAHERVQRAINRVQSLTTGGRRPSFVLFEGGYHAWGKLRERLDDANQRAADACAGIERERR